MPAPHFIAYSRFGMSVVRSLPLKLDELRWRWVSPSSSAINQLQFSTSSGLE